ncbi:hypothetical protein C2S52_014531 [Perilla frutescens var. hirtella]|nr:hypothetical protein C2S52_014531 [Perilla frutescens var. hirtella]KAH6816621.1 hypothetical protein C2S51_021441 [Perilla frutescens var. frutescens]
MDISDALQAETARLRAEAEEMKKQLENTRRAHQQAEEERHQDKARQELMWQQLYRCLDDRDGLP